MFCTNCGKKIKDGALFCTECGARVEGTEEVKEVQTPVQPEVVTQESASQPVENDVVEQSVPEKKKNRLPLIIAIAVVVVALILGGILLIMGGNNEDKDDDKDEDERTEQMVDDDSEELDDSDDSGAAQDSEDVVDFSTMSYKDILQYVESEGNEVDGSDRETLQFMGSIFLEGYMDRDFYRLTVSEMTEEEKGSLNYTILNNLVYHEVYGLEIQDVEIEGQEYATVLKTSDVDAFLANFYEGGSAVGMESGLVIDGDYTAFHPADGGEWVTFRAMHYKQYEGYCWVRGNAYVRDNVGGCEYIGEMAFLVKRVENSKLGFQIVYVERLENSDGSYISSISASSSLDDYNDKTYGAENLIDGNKATAWVENVDGVGIGETITIEFDTIKYIEEILFYNGYLGTYRLFDINGKATSVSIDFGNGVVKEFSFEEWDYYDNSDEVIDYYFVDMFLLDEPVATDKIIITITGAVEGSSYADTCISEIEIH